MFEFLRKQWPDQQWLHEAANSAPRTPDLLKLELGPFQTLFVVDDMKLGWDGYKKIAENSAPVVGLGKGSTPVRAFTRKNFNYYVHNDGKQKTYIPIEADKPSVVTPNCKISGELHAVESKHFKVLDVVNDNGVQFHRKRVQLILPYREMFHGEQRDERGKRLPPVLQGKDGLLSPERIFLIEAWMYVGNPQYWNELLDGGYLFSPVWVSTAYKGREWLDQYYNLVHPYEKPKRNDI